MIEGRQGQQKTAMSSVAEATTALAPSTGEVELEAIIRPALVASE